ncbi:MAG: hypothetical protein OXU39_00725 [Gemmatimonadota bacterium]|nr:hypothetical protein [Gemmatimonadota bacterium]
MSTNAASGISTPAPRLSWPPSGTKWLADPRRRGIDLWWTGGLLGSYARRLEAFLSRLLSPVLSGGGAPRDHACLIAFLEES